MNSLIIATTTSAIRATVARIQAESPETDADALLRIIEAEVPAFDDVMTGLCRAADEARAECAAIAMRIAALNSRVNRAGDREEQYRALIFAALDAAGQRGWKSPEFTVSVAPGKPGVVITDASAIPDAFVRVKREPDKTAIGCALREGPVPGAELRNGSPSLTIRTK